MSDLIDRQEAISVVSFAMADSPSITREDWNAIIEAVQCIPSASPDLSEEDMRLIKKLRSFHNGSYAVVLDKLITSACNKTNQQATVSNDCISRKDAIDAINAYLGLSAVSRTIQNMTSIQEILEKLPAVDTDLSTFSDNLWKIAYERGKAEGQTEAWEFAIDAYYGTTKEQELFECLTFTQAKTEREELRKCEEKNNAGQIFVELANHINRCINDSVKKMREGEEE